MSAAFPRRLLLSAAVAVAGLSTGLGAFAQAPIVIKLSHVVAPDTPRAKARSASRNWWKSAARAA